MSKLITIITINYNNKFGLQKTIDSVLKQTFIEFEYIIIDGDSNDGSKNIIETYKNKFSYSVSEPDTGVYNAMNKGIVEAKGKYLLFLNSGDLLNDETTLEKVAATLCGKFGIYYGNAIYLGKNVETTRTYPDTLSFSFFLQQNLSHQASFIEKKLFETLFFYNETYKIVSDWEFFIYAICKANIPYKHLNLIISKYDTTGISSIINNHELMYQERQKTLERYFPSFIYDYTAISIINSKRGKQFIAMQKQAFAWRFLKWFMDFLLIFLPKKVRIGRL